MYFNRWLLDIVIKNYTVLNTKLKGSQNAQIERNTEVQSVVLDTPSKLSIHSNPFKPIKELVSKMVTLLKKENIVMHIIFTYYMYILLVSTSGGHSSIKCIAKW